MEELKPGGGFIFTLPFNAIGDAKVENVKAMTKAVFKYGETSPFSTWRLG